MGKKTRALGPHAMKMEVAAGKKPVSRPKATLTADWAKSTVTHARLLELEKQGLLPSQEAIGWRTPGEEIRP